MKPAAALFSAVLALGALATPASGQLFLIMSTARDSLQNGPYSSLFQGGELYVGLQDGTVVLGDCSADPSVMPIPPLPISCPLGSTGFIANGDFDNDGIRDGLAFWSISSVVPAILIQPFAPERCTLSSAPPSELPRPLGPFLDRGALVFYNIFTPSVMQYNVASYEFIRTYPPGGGGRSQMKDEVVIGQYIYTFPVLNSPGQFVPISVAILPMPEAVDPAGRYPENDFRFSSGTWSSDGFYLMDPRLTTKITWSGNTPQNTFVANDELRLGIVNPGGDTTYDPDMDAILFPPSGDFLLLQSPLEQEYLLPPFFFNIGDEVLLQLRLDRTLGTTSIAFDISVRLFNCMVRFVDSYAGFRLVTFPAGSSAASTSFNGNFDGDALTNGEEYALGSNPTSSASTATFPTAVQNGDGTVSFTVTKRTNGAANYQFLVSSDGGTTYKLIGNNDPLWAIAENSATTLTITTKVAATAGDYLSKVKVTEVVLR